MQRRRFLAGSAVGIAAASGGCVSLVRSVQRDASVAWRHDTTVEGFQVGEDRVVTRSPTDVTALAPDDGSVEWRVDVPEGWGLTVGPRFVFSYGPGGVVAIDPADGNRVWSAEGSYQSVYREGDTLTAYTSDGRETVAFDPATGAERWSWTDAMIHERAPTFGLSFGGELTVVDLRTGEARWSLSAGTDQRPVTVDDDTLYVAVAEESRTRLLALALADGSERWRRELPPGADDGALHDGRLYVTSGDRSTVTVHALEPTSGEERWSRQIPDWSTDAVPRLTTGERIVFGQSWWDGTLPNACALDGETGDIAWQRQDHQVVAASGGTTALTTTRGRFVGLADDGERRWERTMKFVPNAGGGDSRYRPPSVFPGEDRFVTGFSGTNVLYEYGIGSGRRAWKLHLDETFTTVRRDGSALYAIEDTGVTKVEIA